MTPDAAAELSPERREALRAYETTRSVAYKTVDMFAGITKRKLWLRHADVPGTDGHEIRAPFFHSSFYRLVELQLAHILFKSDPQAARLFVETYTEKVQKVGEKLGVPIALEDVRQLLGHIIAQLERRRVLSLWGLLYAGSRDIIRDLDREAVAEILPEAHEGLLSYVTCLSGDPEGVAPGDLDCFEPYILEAFRKVCGRDFTATLMVSKWLVVQLVNQIIRETRGEPPPSCPQRGDGDNEEGSSDGKEDESASAESGEQQPWHPEAPQAVSGRERAQALSRVLADSGDAPEALEGLMRESSYVRSRTSPRSQALASKALCAPVGDGDVFDAELARSEDRMQDLIAQVLQEMKQVVRRDAWLQKDAMAKVTFIDHDREGSVNVYPDERRTIRRLRAQFYRVLGRRASALEESGTRVDVGAYLERHVTGVPVPCFRSEARGQGFRSILLLDRSSSMGHSKTIQCRSAYNILNRALRFPFVESLVWGFSSQEPGQITITRYDSHKDAVLSMGDKGAGGGTPLHVAIRLAVKELRCGTEVKHIFIVTDGFPTHRRRDGKTFGTPQLMRFVRKEVQQARAQGIGVTGILLGSRMGPGFPTRFDLEPSQLSYMFGPQRFWRRVRAERIGSDLVQLVSSSFIQFLRRR